MMANPFEKKSAAFWADGMECAEAGYFNPAAHSLYYSVLQAVYGFAEAQDLLPKYRADEEGNENSKHKVVRQIVNDYNRGAKGKFVRALNRLRIARVKADYNPEDVTGPDLVPCLDDAEKLRQFFINFT